MIRKIYSFIKTQLDFISNPLASLEYLKEGMQARSASQNIHIIERIVSSYRKAKVMQQNNPLPYKPGGEWDEYIKTTRIEYLDALRENNIKALSDLLSNFFRNSGVVGLYDYGHFENILKAGKFTQKRFINSIKR